jgi:hypothetical protein
MKKINHMRFLNDQKPLWLTRKTFLRAEIAADLGAASAVGCCSHLEKGKKHNRD